MSYIKPQNAIIDNELLRAPTENAVFDALALKQDAGSYITQLTGEVTASGPGIASATISSLAVTNSKLALMVTGTLKGNNSGIPASPSDLNGTTVTSMLDVFVPDTGSGGLKGLVPAPTAADSTRYLRGDGTWDTISVPASANPYLSNLLSPTAINQVLLGLDGSASVPAYSFTNDSNTGIYRSGSDTLNFATNGTDRLQVESGGSVKLMSVSGADILWDTDGAGNIGASGLNRPNRVYIKTALNLNSLAASAILGSDASKNVISLDAATATSYLNNFVGDGGSGGIKGLVPAPAAGYGVDRYLKADGSWATIPSGMSNPMTTIGDVIVGGIAGTPTRLALGTVDKVLVSDGTTVTYQYAGLGGGNFGTDNVILGRSKPSNITTANANALLGVGAGDGLTTGAFNTLLGNYSGSPTTFGGTGLTTGSSNILIGYRAGQAAGLTTTTMTAETDNVVIGNYAYSLSRGSIAIGSGASAQVNGRSWAYNIAIGYGANAGSDSYGGVVDNISIGRSANTNQSTRSIAIGALSNGGAYWTWGDGRDNVVVGYQAQCRGLSQGIVIGEGAGNNLLDGYYNVVLGSASATVLTTGANNTILGTSSATSLTTGSNNVIIGKANGTTLTTGSNNVLIGNGSGTSTRDGIIAIGDTAAISQTGDYGVFIGQYCGSGGNGATAVAIGFRAGAGNNATTWNDAICLGNHAGYQIGTQSIGIGIQSMAIGRSAYSIGIGPYALRNGACSYSVALGYYAGVNATSDNSVFIGKYAGQSCTTNDEFYLGNQNYANNSDEKNKSLLYGKFNATETSQTLRINAQTYLAYGTQIAAKTGATKVTSNTSINLYDQYIGVDTATPAASVTVTLPSAATAGPGKLFIIKDEGGSALTYNVIIARNGSDTIEGAASNLTLANNREAAYLVSDGVGNWNRI